MSEKRKGNVYVEVNLRNDTLVSGEWVSTIDAIHRMHGAIAELRRASTANFDPSWGEQPRAILAPSEAELTQV